MPAPQAQTLLRLGAVLCLLLLAGQAHAGGRATSRFLAQQQAPTAEVGGRRRLSAAAAVAPALPELWPALQRRALTTALITPFHPPSPLFCRSCA